MRERQSDRKRVSDIGERGRKIMRERKIEIEKMIEHQGEEC
jgi:hypothetical protein